MSFEGKSVLVTGAASGIGRAAALAFAREGGRVAVADVAETGGRETAALIKEAGGDAHFIRVDMRSHDAIRAMVSETVARFGGLDAAFNNAGRGPNGTTVVECDEDHWDDLMAINVKAVWLCMKYEIPEMLKRGGGAIVNTSSGLGNFASPRTAAYVTSKHAVVGLSRSAAIDFGPQNIRVNVLFPGATDTPMLAPAAQGSNARIETMKERIPLRRIGLPEDQAEAAVWLCSDAAAFVNGASLVVDGGLSSLR